MPRIACVVQYEERGMRNYASAVKSRMAKRIKMVSDELERDAT